jgi:tetratricopeptide (TPR) repeat protein
LIYIAKTDFRGAEKLFRDAIGRTPNSSKLYEGLGESLFSLYEFPEAEKSFSKALEIDPSIPPQRSLVPSFIMQPETKKSLAGLPCEPFSLAR